MHMNVHRVDERVTTIKTQYALRQVAIGVRLFRGGGGMPEGRTDEVGEVPGVTRCLGEAADGGPEDLRCGGGNTCGCRGQSRDRWKGRKEG